MNAKPAPAAKPTAVKPASTTEAAPPRASLVRTFASKLGVEPERLMQTLKDTAFKQPYKDGKPGPEVTDSQMMALLVVANEYGLSPFLKEIYAFPAKGGGIVPVVSIDGWIKIVNSRPELKSIVFDYPPDGTEMADYYVGCTITRSDRDAPIAVREYYSECYRDTDPWRSHGRRMTRHKSFIQCSRIAFGYGGIFDPDEAERIANAMAIEGQATEVRGKPHTQEPVAKQATAAASQPGPEPALANPEQLGIIREAISATGVLEKDLFKQFNIVALEELHFDSVQAALDWIHENQP